MSTGNPPVVVKLLAEQRKRCLATIYNAAENSPWWPRLTEPQQNAFKEQVRNAVAVFYDLTRDVVKVTDDDGGRNEIVLDLIRSIHSEQLRLKQQLEGNRG